MDPKVEKTKTLLETKNYKVTENLETQEIRSDTSGIELFHNMIKAYTGVTPQDGSITAETLSAGFEKQHGNIEEIREFIRTGQVISPILDIILSNSSFPDPESNIFEYMQRIEVGLSEGRIITYNSSTLASTEDSLKRRTEIEYLYSTYFNEHRASLNKIFLLTKVANYLSSDNLKEITLQMTEEDWSVFKDTTRLYFQQKNPTKAAENEITAEIYTQLVKTDGAEVAATINRFPVPHLSFITEKAVLHGKSQVVQASLAKYIAKKDYNKMAMEENALEAMIRGNPEVCKAFLNKSMWNTYDLETKACIYSLMLSRSGVQTISELQTHIEQEKLTIEEEVYIKYLEMNSGKNPLVDRINALNSSLKQSATSATDVAHSRYMAGNTYVTPDDGTITVRALEERATINRDSASHLEEFRIKLAGKPEFAFTREVLNNNMIITSHLTHQGNNELRYKALENFNKCYAENATLRTDINDSLLLDKIYSTYFNGEISDNVDPVIKLLALGMPELLSKESLEVAKEEARKSTSYFIFAVNKMHAEVSPRMGDIIADIIFENGNEALKKLKQNKVFNSEDINALRFAILHGRENLVDYCIKKYTNSVKNKQIPHENVHKRMGEQALSSIIRGNKAICLSFIENMWSFADDTFKAQLLNLIITRSGTETRVALVEYLIVNSLLTESLKTKLYESSPIPAEIREIKEFIAPIFDQIKQKQDLITRYESSVRTPEEILTDKTNPKHKSQQKLKQIHNSFTELTIVCIRSFGDNKSKWDNFIQDNLSNLEKYSNVTEESFTAHFGKQSFTIKANEFITNIQRAISSSKAEAASSAFETQEIIRDFRNKNRSPQDIISGKIKPNHKIDSLAELTIACKKKFGDNPSQWNQFIQDNLNKLKIYSNLASGDLAKHFGKQDFTNKADELISNIARSSEQMEAEIIRYNNSLRTPQEITADRPEPNNLLNSFTEMTIACRKAFGDDTNQWNQFTRTNLDELKKYSDVTRTKLINHFGEQDFIDTADKLIGNIYRYSERQEEITNYNNSSRTPQEITVDRPKPNNLLSSFVELTIACGKEFGDDPHKWNQFTENNLSKLKKYSDVSRTKLTEHFGEQDFMNIADKLIGKISKQQIKDKKHSQEAKPDSVSGSKRTGEPKAIAATTKDNKQQPPKGKQDTQSRDTSATAHAVVTTEDQEAASSSKAFSWAAMVDPNKTVEAPNIVAKNNPQKLALVKAREGTNPADPKNKESSNEISDAHKLKASTATRSNKKDDSEKPIDEKITTSSAAGITFGSFGAEAKLDTPKKPSFTDREETRRSRSTSPNLKNDATETQYEHGGFLYTNRGTLMTCLIHDSKTYITKSSQGNIHLLQEVLINEVKEKGTKETETTKFIAGFIGEATYHDLSSLYPQKTGYAQSYQASKIPKEEQQII